MKNTKISDVREIQNRYDIGFYDAYTNLVAKKSMETGMKPEDIIFLDFQNFDREKSLEFNGLSKVSYLGYGSVLDIIKDINPKAYEDIGFSLSPAVKLAYDKFCLSYNSDSSFFPLYLQDTFIKENCLDPIGVSDFLKGYDNQCHLTDFDALLFLDRHFDELREEDGFLDNLNFDINNLMEKKIAEKAKGVILSLKKNVGLDQKIERAKKTSEEISTKVNVDGKVKGDLYR